VNKRSLLLSLTVLAATVLCCSSALPAQGNLPDVNVDYNGGPLIQNVHVYTIFWGPQWKQSQSRQDFFNGFFKALFDDGRYIANLSQYSVSGWKIRNGKLVGTAVVDTVPAASTVTDSEIRAELLARVTAGTLPKADGNSLYFVFTARNVVVKDRHDFDSVTDFAGYHDYASEANLAYAVIPYQGDDDSTLACSHELAEAVTDPEVTFRLSWYDDRYGEIGDIPILMYYAGMIDRDDLTDTLVGADGTQYVVQKEWSNDDAAPVAFAP
jgi:hypothetical protein